MNWHHRLHLFTVRGLPWLLNQFNQRHYRQFSESELRATRKSNTLFVFGSGYSINGISSSEWSHFEQHDTLGFNWFVHQNRVRIDYHLIREVGSNDFDVGVWRPKIYEYASLIRNNPYYAKTIFLVQEGWYAINGNRLIGMKLLPKQALVFRFRNRPRGIYQPVSSSFPDGLVHGPATLIDSINFAHILGWQRIVLVGVDLYDRRYFWLGYDETRISDQQRGASHLNQHNASNGLIQYLGRWRELFSTKGVALYVYNPRSLLAEVLPVFDRQQLLNM